MGRTYVQFRGRGFWTGDGSLRIWLGIVVESVRQWDDIPHWLYELRMKWSSLSIGLDVRYELDQDVTEERTETILRACDEAIEFLLRNQEHGIDHVWLNEKRIADFDYKSDMHVEPILAVGRAFRSLIAGESGPFGTTPANAPSSVDLLP